jgi:hypothetical protein
MIGIAGSHRVEMTRGHAFVVKPISLVHAPIILAIAGGWVWRTWGRGTIPNAADTDVIEKIN